MDDLSSKTESPANIAEFIRKQIPDAGLFAGLHWRISTGPFLLEEKTAREFETLGRVLLQFYRAANLLYRHSVEGRQPAWIAEALDRGKPADLIELQRSPAFKNDVPRIIRPDILLTESGFSITELDSVPGGIGLTGWLNKTYCGIRNSEFGIAGRQNHSELRTPNFELIGGADGMIRGFESIFGDAKQVHIVVSEEAATYRPEMEWIATQLGSRFTIRDSRFTNFTEGDTVYRFFELFDLANVPNSRDIFKQAADGHIRLTPPPKPLFEEKMLFALLWNRNLRDFWRKEMGEGFLSRLHKIVPYTWLVDPAPLPPHAAIPELNLTDWQQLKTLSQRQRELILKVSGFSEDAWGARGVYLGSDLSQADWTVAVDRAISSFPASPYVLQRYQKPAAVEAKWFDFDKGSEVPMKGRARLCPYYFVAGEGDAARPHLGGVLATVVPADKKIVHGMTDAILAPCATEPAFGIS